MKRTGILIFFFFLLHTLNAAHISGGEMYYRYLGPGTAANSLRYEITMRLFRDCSAGGTSVAPMPPDVIISIFDNATDGRISDNNVSRDLSMDQRLQKIDFSCIQFAPEVCYDVGYYHFITDLPRNVQGYTASFQTCCRVGGINNIQYNFGSTNGAPGVTVSCNISGTALLGATGVNSSPVFRLKDTALVCANNSIMVDFGATDADFDSLSYSFCEAFGCASNITNASSVPSGPPLGGYFPSLTYTAFFSGNQPMGTSVSINPATGLITGTAPNISGRYVINVCITEWRGGRAIGRHRKDFIMKVADCNRTAAVLNPQYFTCDGFTLTFSNLGNAVSGTQYFWNFGDPASGAANTSTAPVATHTFTDTGVYNIKLKVSINGVCEDSTTSRVKVYPGFFPAFNIDPPYCIGIPIQFSDQTRTDYGVVNKWKWDFGNPATNADTSLIRNPQYTYNTGGLYRVTFIVGNSFGCVDTISSEITVVSSPPLRVTPRDTAYCGLDTLTLNAVGTGIFSWQPATNILQGNTASPRVFPTTPTTYVVTLNQGGCVGRDSVRVRPQNDLTASINASATNICQDDTLTLTGNSNKTGGVRWLWQPGSTLTQTDTRITRAFPQTNTTYALQARWGNNCFATATKDIVVKPLAVPEAGPGGAICFSQGSLNLQASGGDSYRWVPSAGLSNPAIPNPVASPSATTWYKVFISVNGCAKEKVDSVQVLVRPLPATGLFKDTLICSIDTLKLTTTGVGTYSWSPNYMISNVNAPMPLVSPDVPTTYFVSLTDAFGCVKNDSVVVDVKLFVTIDAGPDTVICLTDSYQIATSSDALSYRWTPPLYLDNATLKRPTTTPQTNEITYRVVANIGKCQSTDAVTIRTVPYPQIRASNDTTICFGDNANITVTGGSLVSWSPATYLTETDTRNTVSVKPLTDIRYIATVRDVLGCPKPVSDSVWVRVYPEIIASTGIRDTSVVAGQPIQLNGSGGNRYFWSPAAGLSNPNIASPLATPLSDIEYKLLVTAVPPGCSGRDSVRIKVYQLPPSLYVPTAFSPNGDGLNDILRPKPLGIRSITYFRVYNRWGELIYATSQLNAGWDGRYKGNPQDPGTFVWEAEAITFRGETIRVKGSSILIR